MLVSLSIVGLAMAVVAGLGNPFAEFCTTKAYGWPFPWRIDYCPCEGGKTAFPVSSVVGNAGVLLVGGFLGACAIKGRGCRSGH